MAAIRTRGRGRRTINEINMVPFIDVMLVLLIIFMVTAPMLTPSTIELPSVGSALAGKQPEKPIEIQLQKNGLIEIKLGTKSIKSKPEDMIATIKKMEKTELERPFVIAAEKTIQYERVLQVMEKLKEAGVKRVGLSVKVAQ